jgi:phospholipid-binding lipoprotein MlaA
VNLATKILFVLAVMLAAGCATTNGDPRDPLEPMNRAVYNFNEAFDQALAKPVATAYRDVVPEPVRGWVRNFFGNIADIFIGFNNILQGKPDEGLQDWVRFVFNTVFGVFGINDVASDFGIEKHDEDFGQTFGRWGVGEGAYLVLPILGPSTLRDGVGTGLDLYTDPVGEVHPNRIRNSAIVVRAVGKRADLLDAGRILEEAALDKYVFLRDAYLQRRRNQVYDGRPPRDPQDRLDREERRREDQQAPQEKRSAAEPVNDATPSSVDGKRAENVFLPRIPSNYDAVMASRASEHASR